MNKDKYYPKNKKGALNSIKKGSLYKDLFKKYHQHFNYQPFNYTRAKSIGNYEKDRVPFLLKVAKQLNLSVWSGESTSHPDGSHLTLWTIEKDLSKFWAEVKKQDDESQKSENADVNLAVEPPICQCDIWKGCNCGRLEWEKRQNKPD